VVKHPVNKIENTYNKIHTSKETTICFAYESDLIQIYDFYCARYKNVTWEEFMNLGITELKRKIQSIPESEPLHTIIKSRVINLAEIKDKHERKYWQNLKKVNKIPDIYKPSQELDETLKSKLGGIKNGNKSNKIYGKN
jgi:hypothetical protein